MTENTQLAKVVKLFGTDVEKIKQTKTYVILDTRYRFIDEGDYNSTLDHFTFIYGSGRVNSPGTIMTTTPLSNIIAMKIYKTKIPVPSSKTPLSYKIGVSINEFTAQAYDCSGNKVHWLLGLSQNSNINNVDIVVENYNDGIFNFSTPINVVNSLSISFSDPIHRTIFYNDRGLCTYTGVFPQTITTVYPHNFSNIGNSTYIRFIDFTTADPVKDKDFIEMINTTDRVASISSSNTLTTFTPGFAGITPMPSGTIFTVFYSERRIFMPLEFTIKN